MRYVPEMSAVLNKAISVEAPVKIVRSRGEKNYNRANLSNLLFSWGNNVVGAFDIIASPSVCVYSLAQAKKHKKKKWTRNQEIRKSTKKYEGVWKIVGVGFFIPGLCRQTRASVTTFFQCAGQSRASVICRPYTCKVLTKRD